MITIIKQELDIDESLKTKLLYICEFANTIPTFIKGNMRKLDKTNLIYIEPHRIIIKRINFLYILIVSLTNSIKKYSDLAIEYISYVYIEESKKEK